MNVTKNSVTNQDPDYISPVSNDEKQQKIYEETARTNTAKKITAIVEREFSQEIDTKEKEALEIQERLHKALKTLHLLRYVIITDFYNRKQCQATQAGETKQIRIHPAIKQLIGKAPKHTLNDTAIPSTSTDSRFLNGCEYLSTTKESENNAFVTDTHLEHVKQTHTESLVEKRSLHKDSPRPKKIPRYVPPKSGLPEPPCPSRGVRHKVRKRIVVGNISKWIPPDWREDAASHKWTMYVRGNKEDADIGDFVSKVRFFLHPSYRPNDVVEVTSAPFHLSRRGWGEFPLRVQLHFKNVLNKPMDIIHHLKLDRTYTGLQTLGSETLVDVWIYAPELRIFDQQINESLSTGNTSDKVLPAHSSQTVKIDEFEKSNAQSITELSALCTTQNDPVTVSVKIEESGEMSNTDDKLNSSNVIPINNTSTIKIERSVEIFNTDDKLNNSNVLQPNNVSSTKTERSDDMSTNTEEKLNNPNVISTDKVSTTKVEVNNCTESNEETNFLRNEYVSNYNNPLNTDQIRFYIQLDHDYLNSQYFSDCIQDTVEDNIIKEHSYGTKNVPSLNPSRDITSDKEIKTLITPHNISDGSNLQSSTHLYTSVSVNMKNTNEENPATPQIESEKSLISSTNQFPSDFSLIDANLKTNLTKNGLLRGQIKPETQNSLSPNKLEIKDCIEVPSLLTSSADNKINKLNRNMLGMQTSIKPCSSAKTNMQPLKISIPPLFEPSKHVLVLKNDKLLPIDVTTKTDSTTNKGSSVLGGNDTKGQISLTNVNCTKSRTGVVISRGISLLKKPQTCNAKPGSNVDGISKEKSSILKIKPSTSLLLNMNYNVPALKIADSHLVDMKGNSGTRSIIKKNQIPLKEQPKTSKSEDQEEKAIKGKITVGKDKYKIQSKKDLYEDMLKSIDDVRITNIESLFRFIIRRLPIVTQYALDPEYKRLHPYACPNEKEFFSHNVGKQRAFEWYRAKMIWRFLQKKIASDTCSWTVKEIMIWARLHGYTPVTNSFGIGTALATSGTKKLPGSATSLNISTCTEPLNFHRWLQSCHDTTKSRLTTSVDEREDEAIDVLFVEEHARSTGLHRKKNDGCDNYVLSSSKAIFLELDEKLVPLYNLICDVARDIGIRFNTEEIVPGVVYCAAGRIMIRALECLMEDLLRSSFAKAWERSNDNGCPKDLSLDDVRGAITSREEFDIFTNEGLGSQQHLIAKD